MALAIFGIVRPEEPLPATVACLLLLAKSPEAALALRSRLSTASALPRALFDYAIATDELRVRKG